MLDGGLRADEIVRKWTVIHVTLMAAGLLALGTAEECPEPVAPYSQGQDLMAQKRYTEAVEAFSASREAFRCTAGLAPGERKQAQQRIADQIRQLRDMVRSLDAQRLATQGIPAREVNRDSPATLGQSLLQIQQLEERIAELERLKKRIADPRLPPEISLALGGAYFQSGALADAEREFLAALEVDPRSGDAQNNLAVVYMLTGRLTEAERAVALAEKAGVAVEPRLKQEIRKRKTPQ